MTVVVASSNSNHSDDVGVYLAFLPPGGASNPGGCTPAGVVNLGVFTLLPGDRITIKIDPPWTCTNPAVVAGLTWTLKAIADVHADDFASCSPLAETFDSTCSLALPDDHNNNSNHTLVPSHPIVNLGP